MARPVPGTADHDRPAPAPGTIGFFDSGVGGVSVVREFRRLRPEAAVFYIADWEYCPYGGKPESLVRARAHDITRMLLAQGCQVIVVACNTATAVAIDSLRTTFDVPFVGMEPAVKPAALHSKSGVVGILATENTFHGRLFKETSARFADRARIVTAVGRGFVERVEAGDLDSPGTEAAVREAIQPLLDVGVDHLVLGCTHYPFLKPVIQKVAGPGVVIVDPSLPVARRAAELLDGCAAT
ncbi:MAG: glutamate racemase [Kiritimatiellia bacterium]|jgi:glutamate racemase